MTRTQHLTHWPQGTRCTAQERDAEVLFWNTSLHKVRQARKETIPTRGAMPVIGLRYQVDTPCFEDGDETKLLTND
ncbi:hypothetical protein [Photobacterium carnosum]|uniref:hypothetical protein n=1 Tax=Photobacterium carnosum TaxID=2023717 RepID=UPI001E5D51A4|nr:hypothetical protein [Photobacterium carnosum]MCD9515583.1 hypothetical protein [Photobacterium carnosum]